MTLQYVGMSEKSFEGGVDAHSAENTLEPGFVEDAVNFNFTENGYAEKRPGYVTYGGGIPLRVVKVSYNGTTLSLTFDASTSLETSIDFSSIATTPLIVYGHLSNPAVTSGDFTFETDAVQYYSTFVADPRVVFAASSVTSQTILGSTHGAGTDNLFVGVTQSTSTTDNSNSTFYPESVSIDASSFDVDVSVVNGSTSPITSFIYLKDKSPVPGAVYVHAIAASSAVNISAATHGLANFNILVRCYETSSTQEVMPDSIIITPAGEVQITFSSSFTGRAILSSTSVENSVTGTIGALSSSSITLSGLTEDFVFADPYLEVSVGGNLERVLPESIVVDATSKTATVTFINSDIVSRTFYVYFETARLTTNKLSIVPNVAFAAPFEDTAPQLTVWGLDHESLYPNSTAPRPGWVTHIDKYESEGISNLVAGLGWNLFSTTSQNSQYLMPTWYSYNRARVSTSTVIGPAFADSGDTPSRTRGYITFDGGGDGSAIGSSLTYNALTGWVDVTLSCPNMVVNGTLSTIIKSGATIRDWASISQGPYKVFNGDFPIRAVSQGVNSLTLSLEIPAITSSDYDSTDCGAQVGIFTDELPLTGENLFLPGDILQSNGLSSSQVLSVVATESANIIRVSGATTFSNILGGLLIVGKSPSTRVIPLRKLDGTFPAAEELNIVQGDMVTLPEFTRQVRVTQVLPNPSETVTVVGNGSSATVTVGSTTYLKAGYWIALYQGIFAGQYEITEILSDTQFTVSSTMTGTASMKLGGTSIVVDEALPDYGDAVSSSNSVTVSTRWVPVEAPTDSYELTPVTNTKYFSTSGYTSQPTMRSVMVNDNMYLSNGFDPVFKYDGTDVYRAGLPRWQPGLFAFVTNEGSGAIDIPQVQTAATCSNAANSAVVKTTLGEEQLFAIGDLVKYSGDSQVYSVTKITDDKVNGLVTLSSSIVSAYTSKQLTRDNFYRYYFRLNAIDANQNLIGCATTGEGNFRIHVTQDCDIKLRLVGLPAWDIYDYDRLEVEVYRTLLNGNTFYRVRNVQMDFDVASGYIDVQDFESDDTLQLSSNLDILSTSFKGAELANAVRPPVRSKYVTSLGNRLVLANIKNDPTIDVTFLQKPSTVLSKTSFDGNIFTLRKSNVDTGNTTDMTNRVRFHLRSSGDVAVTALAVSGELVTVTAANTLATGDWVYLFRKAAPGTVLESHLMGHYQVESATSSAFVIREANAAASYTLANEVDRVLVATDSRDVPVWLGQDYNCGTVTGNEDSARNATLRWANACNATQRMVNIELAGFADFIPWVIAAAGDEFGADPRIIFECPKVISTSLEVELPSGTLPYEVFGNQVRRVPGASIGQTEELKPSRLLVSYAGFPELFDDPFSPDDTQSDSAIDINSADGQEITGIIPFFGESAFGASQNAGILAVFKTNSIYVVDINQKRSGGNPVQRLETQGLGCTYPFSIAPTREGIMFANDAGIYKLGRDFKLVYIGQKLENKWVDLLSSGSQGIVTGHHYGAERQYRLSVPLKEDGANVTANNSVFVYNHTLEAVKPVGSWSVFDNHPVTGWVNFGALDYFASTKGRVFGTRATGDNSDYRDDASAISASITFRAMDFGDQSIRKRCVHMIAHFKNATVDMTGTTFYTAIDLKEDFTALDSFEVNTPSPLNNLGDMAFQKVSSIRFSIPKDKFLFLQPRLVNATIDEPVKVTSLDFRVAGLNSRGTPEAAKTRGN